MLIVIILACLFVVFMCYGYLSHYHLKTTEYQLTSHGKAGVHTFAVLSDLHACHHGRDNRKLMKRIHDVQPDIILIPGDMVTKKMSVNQKKVQRVIRLLKELSRFYGVYYAPGNHEIRLQDYDHYLDEIKGAGVKYLQNEECFFPDEGVRIYGLDLPIEWYREKRNLSADDVGTCLNKERADDTCYNILLAHDPCSFPAYAGWGADLTVSGHLHGGILRLPVLGGVLSPYMGFFPEYDGGVYERDGKNMVVSRGLGSHHLKFRWFNPPELVVIHLK